MLIKTVTVLIELDTMNVLSKRVPEHEVDLLKAVHAEVMVNDNSDESVELPIDLNNEYQRLVVKYGSTAVQAVYGLTTDNKLLGLLSEPKAKG